MRIVCCAVVFAGAVLLIAGLVAYCRSLAYMKEKTAAYSMFDNWMYLACLVLITLFCVGYIAAGVRYAFRPLIGADVLTAFALLVFAVFVFIVVRLQTQMMRAMFHKTGEMVRSLVHAVEAKDVNTLGHSDHVLNLVRLFYHNMPDKIKSEVNLNQLMDAAILHDIGKIKIPDEVLRKTGALSAQEWEAIRQHPNWGKELLKNTSYQDIGDIIRMHHERMDGKGYYGVPGHVLPIESRMIAIADTFSALYTSRAYRSKQDFQHAISMLRESAGTQLDAALVDIFCNIQQGDLDAAGYIFADQISYVR